MAVNRSKQAGGGSSAVWGLGFIGFLFGSVLGQSPWGAVSGAAMGVLFALLLAARTRLTAVESALTALESRSARVPYESDQISSPAASETATSPIPEDRVVASVSGAASTKAEEGISADGAPRVESSSAAQAPPAESPVSVPSPPRSLESEPAIPAKPSLFSRGLGVLRSFFFGGNTVVRVGLLVLLVGLVLLAKYAAENALFPIEARLGLGALIGLSLVGFGFRQRIARPGFGMSLQGGGIAALYLITFFAFKFYGLIPSGLAFALFVGLAISTAMLSLLQKSEALIVIGSLGAFAAPVLASTGGGSHVALFSYYLLLIASIGWVAWRESWRVPGLVAFFCTYGVATTWGVLRYDPALYASTQPFVLAFMTLFTGIAFLHATREKSELRGFVDGTLVFGTAFVSIMIQAALVREKELGLALSAAGFGLFYMGWSFLLWRRSEATMRPLAEAFLALAVGFATMAIPFAFNEALTTSVAWALEGAGLYWVGVRQSRPLARAAGFALQLLGAVAFFVSAIFDRVDSSAFLPVVNGRAMSCLALAFAGIFIARMAWVHRDRIRGFETVLAQGLGIVGLLWWTAGSFAEIEQFSTFDSPVGLLVGWLAATLVLLEVGSARFGWAPGRLATLASLPLAATFLLGGIDDQDQILADGGLLTWPLLFAGLYFLWERLKEVEPRPLLFFRAGCLWLLAIFVAWVFGSSLAEAALGLSGDWPLAFFAAGLASVLFAGLAMDRRGASPFDREEEHARLIGLGPIAGAAVLTMIGMQFATRGDASPIPHIPLLNPSDLMFCLLGLSVFAWWRAAAVGSDLVGGRDARRVLGALGLGLGFLWLNGILVRAVHQWAAVPFDPDRLWDSVPMQVSLSIAWTVVGLIGMLLSSRRGWRPAWMGFAALLGVVVVKLFTVDLSQLSTVSRIGTFLAVGGMLLVLGYLSPVPPGGEEDETAEPGPQVEGESS